MDRGGSSWRLEGYCAGCSAPSSFGMDLEHSWVEHGVRVPNWRERLVCGTCGLNNRMRAALHWVASRFDGREPPRIYATEQVSAFFARLRMKYPAVVGSEYLGPGMRSGASDARGLRHEDAEALSFDAASFDLVLSQDVLEHVANPERAMTEFGRILAPGGSLFLSVPFDPRRAKTIRRASIEGGAVVHHLPPEFHSDPMKPEDGCLVFSDFGWDVLEMLRDAGFRRVRLLDYWSESCAYLGDLNYFFVAERESAA